MECTEFSGHRFIKVGEFVKSENPLQIKFDGHDAIISVELALYREEFKKIGESVYMITMNTEPVYVGEYSGTLEDRWLKTRKSNYIWHNKDVQIAKYINEGNALCFYLARDIFVFTGAGKRINIAKSIEHDILQDNALNLWNKRNVCVDRKGHSELSQFIQECWK